MRCAGNFPCAPFLFYNGGMRAKRLPALFALLLLLLVISVGCEAAQLPIDLSPSLTPSSDANQSPSGEKAYGVAVHILTGSQNPTPGTQLAVILRMDPVIQVVERRADGTVSTTGYLPWTDHQVAQMQYCVTAGNPCEPSGQWAAFTGQVDAAVGITWLGPRKLWAVARFRDQAGNPVLGIDENQRTGALARDALNLIASVNPATPEAAQPPFVKTLVAATSVSFPVTGSVKIADGRCCLGGKAGSRIDIPVSFSASSPLAPVTGMRLAYSCPVEGENIQAPWEPFQAERTYATTAAINWTGWYIAVQYRDAKGNLSPVYCSDISIEGNP